tara:strand:- start:421 stop:1044 length:624 start_codon:yes stop_codon:yes gene_type:complete
MATTDSNPIIPKVLYVVVFDTSGSMYATIKDQWGSVLSFKSSQKDISNDSQFVIVPFSHKVQQPIITKMDEEILFTPEANGATALFDAIGSSILLAEKKCNQFDNVYFITVTDGEENESKEFKNKDIKTLIASHPEWKFIYMGANQDAIENGGSMGFRAGSCMTYTQSPRGSNNSFEAVSQALNRSRINNNAQVEFTNEERESSQAL